MRTRLPLLFLLSAVLLPVPGFFPSAHAVEFEPKVYLEDMTWMDVRDRLNQGTTTIIVPTGGTEQNGPGLAIGKHNFVVAYTAAEIARKLGNALVAPVLAYVPEGRISPPEGHMRFPGTISVAESTFAAVLEDTARSMKEHGFHLICFVGDHGGSQQPQERVADKLNEEWHGQGARVLSVSDYYGENGQEAWLKERGLDVKNPSAHGGFLDASELLAVRPGVVKKEQLGAFTEAHYPTTGAAGDASKASADYGKKLLALKVNAAVDQIRKAEQRR